MTGDGGGGGGAGITGSIFKSSTGTSLVSSITGLSMSSINLGISRTLISFIGGLMGLCSSILICTIGGG